MLVGEDQLLLGEEALDHTSQHLMAFDPMCVHDRNEVDYHLTRMFKNVDEFHAMDLLFLKISTSSPFVVMRSG